MRDNSPMLSMSINKRRGNGSGIEEEFRRVMRRDLACFAELTTKNYKSGWNPCYERVFSPRLRYAGNGMGTCKTSVLLQWQMIFSESRPSDI